MSESRALNNQAPADIAKYRLTASSGAKRVGFDEHNFNALKSKLNNAKANTQEKFEKYDDFLCKLLSQPSAAIPASYMSLSAAIITFTYHTTNLIYAELLAHYNPAGDLTFEMQNNFYLGKHDTQPGFITHVRILNSLNRIIETCFDEHSSADNIVTALEEFEKSLKPIYSITPHEFFKAYDNIIAYANKIKDLKTANQQVAIQRKPIASASKNDLYGSPADNITKFAKSNSSSSYIKPAIPALTNNKPQIVAIEIREAYNLIDTQIINFDKSIGDLFEKKCRLELGRLKDIAFNTSAAQSAKEKALNTFITALNSFIEELPRHATEHNAKAKRTYNTIASIAILAGLIVGAVVAGGIITLASGGTLTIPYLAGLSASGGLVSGALSFGLFRRLAKPLDMSTINIESHTRLANEIKEAANNMIKPKA